MRKTYFLNTAYGSILATLVSARNRFSSRIKFFSLLLLVLLVSGESWGQAILPVSRTTWNVTPIGWTDLAGGTYLTIFACTGSNGGKFANTGDKYVVYFTGTPNTVSFTTKGNVAPGGSSLLLQESSDGSSYTTVSGTITLGTTCTSYGPFNLLSTTRYIKWTFTKGSANLTFDDVVITAASVTPTKLAITSVPSTVYAGTTFSVTVQSLDESGNAGAVTSQTGISLTNSGGGTIAGNTGNIANATSSVTLSGVTLNTPATGVTLTASATSGMSLTTSAVSSTFTVYSAIPSVASAVSTSARTSTGTTVNWTNGGGTGRIVVARLSSAGAVAPTLGTTYSPSLEGSFTGTTTTGTGNIVVYNGTGNTIAVTNLTNASAYIYDVYEYNGSGSTISYSAAASSSTTYTLATEPTAQPTTMTFTNVNATGMTIGCTAGTGGSGRIFVVKAGSEVDFVPTDGTAYTANLNFSNGTGLGTNSDNKVVAITGISAAVTGLSSNTTYYVAVYEYNGATNTYNYLTSSSLTGNRTTTPTPATIMLTGLRTGTSIDVSWTNGNGTGRIVVARLSSTTAVAPTNGITYTPNSTDINDLQNPITGTGNFVIYNGSGSTTGAIGLASSTDYRFDVYEYSGTNYSAALTSSAISTLAAEPTVQSSVVTFSAISATGLTVNFTKGDGDYRVILVKSGSSVDGVPVDATSYSTAAFGNGTKIGADNYVVYSGSAGSVSVSGLSANTTYHIAIFEFNGSGGNINYKTNSPITGNQITLVTAPSTPTALSFGSVTYNSFTASFTAPISAPDGYLVVRRKGLAVSETPAGGTVYNVGQSVGSVAANEVIYIGTSPWTNENQTGLSDNSTYYYAVYSYAGASTQTNYSSALTGSQITSIIPATTSTSATNINSTGFRANWNIGNGASGYKLDVSTASDFGNTSILSESFIGCSLGSKASPDGTDISSSLDTKLQTTGWTGNSIYQAGGVIKLGASSSQGYIVSKALPLSSQNTSGIVDLSFDLQLYGSDANTSVQVFHASNGTSFTQIGSDLTATTSIVTVNLKITGATTLSKIKIAAKTTSSNRFFLDNINIKQDISFITSNENVTVTTTNKDVSGLSPNTTYYYRVRATSTNSTSENSNTISVTTLASYTIAASANDDAKGSVSGGGTKDAGTSVSLTATASEGYRFVNWTEGGSFVSIANPYTFTALANRTLEANFADFTSTITSATNASTIADCPTCNVVISNTGTLTIDGTKEYNSITVESGGKLNTSQPLTVGNLVLKAVKDASSFSSKIDAAITATSVKLYKTIDNTKWYYMAFPCDVTVAAITKSNGDAMTGLGTDWFIKYYDGAQRGESGTTATNWKHIGAITTLAANRGYIFGLKTGEVELSIPLNTSVLAAEEADKNIAVAANTGAAANTNHGWNLIGHPYMSTYNAQSNASAPNFMIMPNTDGKTYTQTSKAGSSLPTGLKPFAAYFVQAGGAGNISFGLNGRQSVPASVAAEVSENIKLNFTTATGTDYTYLIMDNNQTTGYQIGEDMVKWLGTGTDIPQVYTLLGDISYAFNALPMASVVNLPVGLYTKTAGTSTISVNAAQAPSLSKLLLTDKTENITTDLLLSDYSFSATAGTDNTRFVISAQRVPTANPINLTDAPSMLSSNGKLVINELSPKSTIRIYDAIGRNVFNKVAMESSIEIPLQVVGMYTVHIDSGIKNWTIKIVNNK